AKPFAEQSMKIEYVPVRFEGRTDLYVLWKNYQSNQSGLK
ncbi:MAG TPA: nucleoside deaminase, partial [Acinetobacter nosocomialis]|nr:nucleoside deaminase [Acinetobacter nosocomialis]